MTTSGEPLQVVELAQQLGLVLGALEAGLRALESELPVAQVEAVWAAVEGQPLSELVAESQKDLSELQECH